MLFTELRFLPFVLVALALHWALRGNGPRKVWLLIVSYAFYAAWDWRFLSLIVASTLIDYGVGMGLARTQASSARRVLLGISLTANLGLLAVFKYLGFFVESAVELANAFGASLSQPTLEIVLPVGISFYTFQTLSYSVDVYRGRRAAEEHLGIFALYVSFFPQLVAGPIERSTRLLPQLHETFSFDAVRVRNGLALMGFGFFKKCVVADRCAIYADRIFHAPGTEYDGFASLLGTYFFQWQLYCDFSGYSDIAIGAAAVLGYDLMTNFRRPFLAVSILDFWNRWHVSLTTWLRDYVYFPLTGRHQSNARRLFNALLVFGLSGLWHGATWNCVLWGLVNGVFLVVGLATARAQDRFFRATRLQRVPGLRRTLDVVLTFHLGTIGLMFFRTSTLSDYLAHVRSIFTPSGAFWNVLGPLDAYELGLALVSIGALFSIQLLQEKHDSTLVQELGGKPRWFRWPVYYAFVFAILAFGQFGATPFFYFQF